LVGGERERRRFREEGGERLFFHQSEFLVETDLEEHMVAFLLLLRQTDAIKQPSHEENHQHLLFSSEALSKKPSEDRERTPKDEEEREARPS
jgi:hypothetical protein